MFNPTQIVIEAFINELRLMYERTYSTLEPSYPGIISFAAQLALETSGFLAPAWLLPGLLLAAAQLLWRAASSRHQGGCGVVVVVVVGAGEAAAWAGTITDLTTGLTQRSGKTSGLNEAPPTQSAKYVGDRLSFEDPPTGAFDAPTLEHLQNIGLRGSTQATTRQGAPRGRANAADQCRRS